MVKSQTATEFFVRAMWEFYYNGNAPHTYKHTPTILPSLFGYRTLEEYYLQVAVMSAEVDQLYYKVFLAHQN